VAAVETVLVVDDDPELRTIVRQWVIARGFKALDADSAEAALDVMRGAPADIAFCDVHMSGRDGVWLASQLRVTYPRTAVIMATSARDVDIAVASLSNHVVDYLLKPFDRARLSEALALGREWHAAYEGLADLQASLHDRLRNRRAAVAAALAEAQETHERALEGLISMLQLHERDGRGHATRVARLTLALADELGVEDGEITTLEDGALLHDIGKLDMPSAILSKPAPLDDNEWRVMRTHPEVGYELLRRQPRFAEAAQLVRAHHESFDGSGYPRGLAGDDIPIGARILAVADAYDSMTQPHTQRPPMLPALAVMEIERCSGHQFDPQCASALGAVLTTAAT
jgi:putative two-component system response regulator